MQLERDGITIHRFRFHVPKAKNWNTIQFLRVYLLKIEKKGGGDFLPYRTFSKFDRIMFSDTCNVSVGSINGFCRSSFTYVRCF